MKKLLAAVLLVVITAFSFVAPASADAASGATVFNANCAACHAGGRNAVNPAKTLSKADLEKYGMFSKDAIVNQVTNGKMAMPAFGGKLSADQISDVADYVLEQAEAGW